MLRRPPAISLLLACAAALALPAAAGSSATPPTITAVKPLKLRIGDTLTITGRHFVRGRNKNSVVFQHSGDRAVFIKAFRATSTRIRVRVSSKLLPYLSTRGDTRVYTRFRLRVLARRLSRRVTPRALSPKVGPPTGLTGPGAVDVSDCDADGIPDSVEADDDNDLLSDSVERQIKTAPCNPDTDGDGMQDGWEYESALDLNSRAVPYPGKRPYPNPLDGGDGSADYDNDGMRMREEYDAWVRYGGHALPLNYSDGTQTTGGASAPAPGKEYLDLNGNGVLSDDEKDVDGDGLGNWNEIRGVFDPSKSPDPDKFPLDWLDVDTDGDGLNDGADDQDHDGYSNLEEMIPGTDGNVTNPLDPCDPDKTSRACFLH